MVKIIKVTIKLMGGNWVWFLQRRNDFAKKICRPILINLLNSPVVYNHKQKK